MKTSMVTILFGLTLLSCTHVVKPPRLESGAPDSPHHAWARVLDTAVDERGRVDFTGIARKPHDLHQYLDYVARVSPTSHPERFPTKSAKLAYYINSYNALAMHGIIAHGVPVDFHNFFDFLVSFHETFGTLCFSFSSFLFIFMKHV